MVNLYITLNACFFSSSTIGNLGSENSGGNISKQASIFDAPGESMLKLSPALTKQSPSLRKVSLYLFFRTKDSFQIFLSLMRKFPNLFTDPTFLFLGWECPRFACCNYYFTYCGFNFQFRKKFKCGFTSK